MKITILEKILAADEAIASKTRALLKERGIASVNLMSSPGSGKTAILERTLESLAGKRRCAVIEGDIATTNDAERLARFDVPVVQVNTDRFGGDCHLGANMVRGALDSLPLDEIDLLFIENVGNLVCPASFDIGEDAKVTVISVTEGEDKPLKYPRIFQESAVALVNKIDLVPHLGTDMETLLGNLAKVNPKMKVITLSATTGEGLDAWIEWLNSLLRKCHRKPMLR